MKKISVRQNRVTEREEEKEEERKRERDGGWEEEREKRVRQREKERRMEDGMEREGVAQISSLIRYCLTSLERINRVKQKAVIGQTGWGYFLPSGLPPMEFGSRERVTLSSDVSLSDRTIVSTLSIRRGNMSDAGTYVCRTSGHLVTSAKVNILNTDTVNAKRGSNDRTPSPSTTRNTSRRCSSPSSQLIVTAVLLSTLYFRPVSTVATTDIQYVSTVATTDIQYVSTVATTDIQYVSTVATTDIQYVSTVATTDIQYVSTVATTDIQYVSTVATTDIQYVSTVATTDIQYVSTVATTDIQYVSTVATTDIQYHHSKSQQFITSEKTKLCTVKQPCLIT
ncbi:hypothetical protein Btru_034766 [Bulinus truncatus]|nr:hypothetical protein Btru_034766 [Bulinus truncatus]